MTAGEKFNVPKLELPKRSLRKKLEVAFVFCFLSFFLFLLLTLGVVMIADGWHRGLTDRWSVGVLLLFVYVFLDRLTVNYD